MWMCSTFEKLDPLGNYRELMLIASNLSCKRNERFLFSKLGFSLDFGQKLHIQGKNGAGKSSLLRILAGLLKPNTGNVQLGSMSVCSLEYNRNFFYIGHLTGMKPELSCYDNLQFWSRIYGCKERAPRDVLAHMGIEELAHMRVCECSAGQKQRLALARLFLEPRLLWLLDEPYASLDSDGADIMTNHIDRFCLQGGIAIVVEHDKPPLHSSAKGQFEILNLG
jgi:heme exporter protein A